jgi:hypothetical protein
MRYTIMKGKYQSISFCVYNFLNKFQRGLPWWHNKYPGLKHVWCYRSHSVPHAGFQVLKFVDLNLVENVLHITPKKKKSTGLKSGDLGGQAIDPHLPIHITAISLSR